MRFIPCSPQCERVKYRMRFDLANLPTDPALLHQLVRDMAGRLANRDTEIERLQLIIRQFQRAQFGRRSEHLSDDQIALGLDDLNADLGAAVARNPPPEESGTSAPVTPARRQELPAHLPREEQKIDVSGNTCVCCGGALHAIGETVCEMLDWVPAQLRVLKIRRPKYGCRGCNTVHQAPALPRPISGGLPTAALLAQVLTAKYCDHTPLYRQSQIFARHGVELERSTLAGWVGGACWWLDALYAKLCENIFASEHLFADDTPVPVLDPGRGRTKTGRLWVYARDDRRWCGPAPPAAVYVFAPDRTAQRPVAHLRDFRGVLQVDGYAGFEQLTRSGRIILAACWAHTRRKFYEIAEATASPIALEALRQIGELYRIEEKISGQAPERRCEVRQAESKPLVHQLKIWLDRELMRLPERNPVADAIRYALSRWTQLCRFLEDGRIELDTNPVERAIRPVALGRKNHLFAGSDGGGARWATICSLVETCKLNDVEPYAYLKDVLERMVEGFPANRLHELLPWAWKAYATTAT
jgi:transposase